MHLISRWDRVEAKELVGDNLQSEMLPFSFKHKDSGEIIKEAAMALVPNLWRKIKDFLDQSSDHTKQYAVILKKLSIS